MLKDSVLTCDIMLSVWPQVPADVMFTVKISDLETLIVFWILDCVFTAVPLLSRSLNKYRPSSHKHQIHPNIQLIYKLTMMMMMMMKCVITRVKYPLKCIDWSWFPFYLSIPILDSTIEVKHSDINLCDHLGCWYCICTYQPCFVSFCTICITIS